jgi:hypothetical protein
LDLVITAPTDTGQHYVAAPLVTAPNRIGIGGIGAWPPEESRQKRDGSVGIQHVDDAPENAAPTSNPEAAKPGRRRRQGGISQR